MRVSLPGVVLAGALGLVAVPARADHPVTITMQSGERVTGRFTDLHNDLVYLRVSQRDEPRIPLSEIAVIDFTNGPRDDRDLDVDVARRGADHLLVLRNGRRIAGRFEGLTGDEQPHTGTHDLEFVFRTANGEYVRVGADRIARIHLGRSNSDLGTTAGNVTLRLENGASIRGALAALDAQGVAMDDARSGLRGRRYLLSDVAVIDFESNGRLDDRERWTDRRGGPHHLMMRDGRQFAGEFVGPARRVSRGAPTYLFRAENGRLIPFTSDTASRLQLRDPGDVLNETVAGVETGAAINVPARQAWTRTGLQVRRGDVYAVEADGEVQLSTDDRDRATARGAYSGRGASAAPLRNELAGALIGRVGNTVFVLGEADRVRMPASGELFLGVNDDHMDDNRGAFVVRLRNVTGSS